ncbi:MAG: 7TM-DISM domain-containing protein, partial [Alcanivoracaceae bacterium]|nr:7TM-DISM domain-containing protein [Alcanivoracaceae bacterium]
MQDFRLIRGLVHLLLLTMLLAPIGASAALLSGGGDGLLASMLWLRDPEQQLGPREALKRLQDTGNINDRGRHPAFGFDRGAIWFLIPLNNDTSEQDWILQAGRPHMDSLDLFLFDQQDQLVASFRHGDQVPWSERPYPHTNLLFPLELKSGQSYRLVFRAASVGAIELPMAVMPPYTFQQYDTTFQNFVGLYLGAIGVMLLFNLLLYISIRDRSYLMYCLYLTGLLGYLTSREGLPFKLLWPE